MVFGVVVGDGGILKLFQVGKAVFRVVVMRYEDSVILRIVSVSGNVILWCLTRCLLSLMCFEEVATIGSKRNTFGAGWTVVRLKILRLRMSYIHVSERDSSHQADSVQPPKLGFERLDGPG